MPEQALITISTRHQSHYERLKSAEVKKFDVFLVQMEKDIRNKLTSVDITDFTRSRLERQLVQIDTLIRRSFKEYKAVWRESILSAAEYEAGFEIRSLGQVVDGVNFAMPSDSQITAAVFNTPLGDIGGSAGGSLLEPWLDDMTATEIKRVQGAIRMGYAQGETTGDIVRRIRGTKASGYSDGVLAITKRNAETVARTALQHAAQQARGEVWKANDSVIKRRKIVATLDSVTSAICRSLDGQEFPLDKGPVPPFHPNCRTGEVAVLDDKYKELSRGRTRSERDPETGKVGKVSADQAYYSWLKTQPADVQNSIIGPTRGKLLRNGGISSQRFAELQMGKNFQPLKTIERDGKLITPLQQMREMEPTAFMKAGL
jgi:SPP1 gp7 family putative phage head morphogenesis protein